MLKTVFVKIRSKKTDKTIIFYIQNNDFEMDKNHCKSKTNFLQHVKNVFLKPKTTSLQQIKKNFN